MYLLERSIYFKSLFVRHRQIKAPVHLLDTQINASVYLLDAGTLMRQCIC